MIFAIGLDKTGTTSLTAALKLLGINATHDVQLAHRLVAELKEGRLDGLLPRYDAWSEAPLAREYEMLVRLFPDAQFILTVRDKEAWIRSRIIHVFHNRCLGSGLSREIDTRAWSRKWDEHLEGVRGLLGGRPNFLEIDVTADAPSIDESTEDPSRRLHEARIVPYDTAITTTAIRNPAAGRSTYHRRLHP